MAEGKVLVVGSANMDLVVHTPRFPAAGETLLGGRFETFPGGKGANQAVAIGKLGGSVDFLAKLGSDAFGDALLASLTDAGVDTKLLLRTDGHPSGVAVITVDEGGQNTIVVAPGSNMNLSPEEVEAATYGGYAIYLAQLEVPIESVAALAAARPADAPFVLNPAPARALSDDLLSRTTYLTPNQSETQFLTGQFPTDDASCLAAAAPLLDRGVENVIITLGAHGSFLANQRGGRHFPTLNVRAVDTTAAGDAFNGALAHFLAQGREIKNAIPLANCAGALAATKPGAQAGMPTWDEFLYAASELL
jgi:ribokinase